MKDRRKQAERMSNMFDIALFLFLLLFSFIFYLPLAYSSNLLFFFCGVEVRRQSVTSTPSLRRFIMRLKAAGGP